MNSHFPPFPRILGLTYSTSLTGFARQNLLFACCLYLCTVFIGKGKSLFILVFIGKDEVLL